MEPRVCLGLDLYVVMSYFWPHAEVVFPVPSLLKAKTPEAPVVHAVSVVKTLAQVH
jgi:hypothetical protein